MILGLAQSLFRLFRENSDVVPVSRLKRQGIKSVTVLDWERVEGLVTRAVEETLKRRGIGLSREALQTVNEEALETFHRLVNERDHLEASARSLAEEKATLEANFNALHSELDRATEQLSEERSRTVSAADVGFDGARFETYAEQLANELRTLAAGGETSPTLPESISEVARRILDEERGRALQQAKEAQRHRMEKLERRITKLQKTLTNTEQVVEKLRASKGEDGGVESIFREVQGLDQGDRRFEEKKGVLDQIFQLNVELRDVIESEGK